MLLRVGMRIINTEHVIKADFSEASEGKQANLLLMVTSSGQTDLKTAHWIVFQGDDADRLWTKLCTEAQRV